MQLTKISAWWSMSVKHQFKLHIVLSMKIDTCSELHPQYTFFDGKRKRSSSVQSLDRLGHQGDMTDDSSQILFQSFLREAIVSNSGTGRDVHSLMLSIQHFLCDHGIATLQGALKNGFGEVVILKTCEVPKPCQF